MRKCKKCGTENSSDRDFCTNCGEYLRWDPTGYMPAVPAPVAAPPGAAAPAGGAPPPVPQAMPGVAPPPFPQAPPPAAAPQAPPEAAPQAAAQQPVVITLRAPGIEGGGPPTVQCEPGGYVQLVALIRNQSGIVDNYDLELEGLPGGWWSVNPTTVYLVPYGSGAAGYEQEVTIDLRPPRIPEAEARPWPFQLVAKSRAQGGTRIGAGPGTLQIGPFTDYTVDIRPQKRAGRRGANFDVAVRNKANAPVIVNLVAADPEESHRFEWEGEKDQVSADPGKNGIARFKVTPPKQRWIGGSKDIRFEVTPKTVGTDYTVPPARGTFEHKAWLPRWVSYAVPFLIAIAVAAFVQFQVRNKGPTLVEVPNLAVATSDFGVEKLLKDKDLKLGKVSQEESKDFKPGTVIKQDPAAGEKVKKNTEVAVVLAVGSNSKVVPNVVGLTFEDANSRIKARGFTIGKLTPEPTADMKVASQDPKARADAKEGAPIDLFFDDSGASSTGSDSTGTDTADSSADSSDAAAASSGADSGGDSSSGDGGNPSGNGDTPSVANQSVDKAQQLLADDGKKSEVLTVISAVDAGKVISQKNKDADTVQLTVSGGMPPLAYDQNGTIMIANGLDGSKATPLLKGDGGDSQPAWSKKNALLAFRRGDADKGQIWIVDPNDVKTAHPLTEAGFDDRRPAFSPNGKVIAFVRGTPGADYDLCFINVASTTGKVSCSVDPNESVSRPTWSPDGQAILVVAGPSPPNTGQIELVEYTSPKANTASQASWTRQGAVTDDMHGARPIDEVVQAAWSPVLADGSTEVAFTANWGADFNNLFISKVDKGVLQKANPIRKIKACEVSWLSTGEQIVYDERDNGCDQDGEIRRADPTNPDEQSVLAKTGASNPAWAPSLPAPAK